MELLQFVNVLLEFEESMPVGIVRPAHERTLSGASALMMPEIVVGLLELIRPGILLEQALLFQVETHLFSRIEEGHVVELNGTEVAAIVKLFGLDRMAASACGRRY